MEVSVLPLARVCRFQKTVRCRKCEDVNAQQSARRRQVEAMLGLRCLIRQSSSGANGIGLLGDGLPVIGKCLSLPISKLCFLSFLLPIVGLREPLTSSSSQTRFSIQGFGVSGTVAPTSANEVGPQGKQSAAEGGKST